MKVLLVIVAIVITTIINYELFVPSSSVNLLIGVFINENNTVILLSDLALSNLIFWGVLRGLLTLDQKIR